MVGFKIEWGGGGETYLEWIQDSIFTETLDLVPNLLHSIEIFAKSIGLI